MPEKLSDPIKKEFIKWLDSLGLSQKTYKNYKSDLVHFLGWAILKVRSIGSYITSLTEIVPFLNENFGHEYKNYMVENSTPVKTVNRRLTTLRHLSRFLVESNTLDFDFAKGLINIGSNPKKSGSINPIISNFGAYLADQKASPITIKNYLSDTRQFLTWLEVNRKIINSKL